MKQFLTRLKKLWDTINGEHDDRDDYAEFKEKEDARRSNGEGCS